MNEGIAKGEVISFIKLVRKKIEKGKSVDEIAYELEETVDAVQKIYDIIKMYGEKMGIDDIYNKLKVIQGDDHQYRGTLLDTGGRSPIQKNRPQGGRR